MKLKIAISLILILQVIVFTNTFIIEARQGHIKCFKA